MFLFWAFFPAAKHNPPSNICRKNSEMLIPYSFAFAGRSWLALHRDEGKGCLFSFPSPIKAGFWRPLKGFFGRIPPPWSHMFALVESRQTPCPAWVSAISTELRGV